MNPTVTNRGTQNGVAQADLQGADSRPRLSRRRLISGASLVALGAAALGARPARALSIEPADAGTANLIANHCSASHDGLHRELVAELRTQLEARGVAIDTAALTAELQRATCPICGCPLILAEQALPPAGTAVR